MMLNFSKMLISLVLLSCMVSFSYAQESSRSISVNKAPGKSEHTIKTGNYWALIIGIDKYAKLPADKQLTAARKDAEGVANLLIKKYNFDPSKVATLYDDEATRAGIIDTLDAIGEKIKEEDSLLIYYAGHGMYSSRSRMKIGTWLPYDGNPKKRSSQLSNATVKEYISQIPAKHILTIADSCYSGSLMGSRTRSLEDLSELNARVIKELYEKKSRWIMTSGGLYPVPDEAPGRNGHSTFAYHLIDKLKKNTSQYLPVSMLFQDVRYKISNDTNEAPKASPLRGSGDDGGEFIFVNTSHVDIALRKKKRTEAEKEKFKEKYLDEYLDKERSRKRTFVPPTF